MASMIWDESAMPCPAVGWRFQNQFLFPLPLK
jgi:hypothetical protein